MTAGRAIAPQTIGCRTVGLTVQLETTTSRWSALAHEACAGQEVDGQEIDGRQSDVLVTIEPNGDRFPLDGLEPLTRGAWSDGSVVVLEDACASGVDLHLTPGREGLSVRARPRPGLTHRGLGLLAPARAQLLWRAVLLQYPALWWAGVTGAVPLHVSALRLDGTGLVLAGPGGVGKSTLLREAAGRGAQPVSDNVCVGRGSRVDGLLEPMRAEGGSGRRMPHGRREAAWEDRLESVRVDRVLVLRRGSGQAVSVSVVEPAEAARTITAGTYAAGELRRYWAFAATLALGTGLGPAHPGIGDGARELTAGIPCLEVLLPATPGASLGDILADAGDVLADAGSTPLGHLPTGAGPS